MSIRKTRLARRTHSPKFRAGVDREAAILEVTERVIATMERDGIRRVDLAKRLRVSRARVTQMLAGHNFTLNTAAVLCRAVGLRFRVHCEESTDG